MKSAAQQAYEVFEKTFGFDKEPRWDRLHPTSREAYRAAASIFAAGPWQTGEPPKDGTVILAEFNGGMLGIARWNEGWGCWAVHGLPLKEGIIPIRYAVINTGERK